MDRKRGARSRRVGVTVGARLNCPLSEAKYVGDLAGIRSTEFGGVLFSEVSV